MTLDKPDTFEPASATVSDNLERDPEWGFTDDRHAYRMTAIGSAVRSIKDRAIYSHMNVKIMQSDKIFVLKDE